MKKTITISLILLGFFLSVADVSAALEKKLEIDWPNSPLGTPLNENTKLPELIQYLYEWGISLGGFAAFIVLVAAGFQYLSSAGNPTKMKDAMDRIKSAVIGLTLLLSSVLILNTINPQLTQLKMPQLPPHDKFLFSTTTIKIENPKNKPCEGADLYFAPEYNGTKKFLDNGGDFDSPTTVGSVKFKGGSCLLQLFYLRNFGENVDYPSISFSNNTPDIKIFGNTNFKSGKLLNTYFPVQK